jgi:ATP-dependent Clp protease ATP-binding subunit ClpA
VEQETLSQGSIPLSDRARQAIEFAVAEAKRLGNEEVTPEHLLLGLIREQRACPTKLPSHARVRRMLATCSVVRMNHLIRVEEPKQKVWRRRPARRATGWLFRLLETIQNEIF